MINNDTDRTFLKDADLFEVVNERYKNNSLSRKQQIRWKYLN